MTLREADVLVRNYVEALLANNIDDAAEATKGMVDYVMLPSIAQPESEPSDREALIAGIKAELANFAHDKTLETLLLDSVDMLEADAQPDTFDKWQKNPYTIVLEKSITEDYKPKQAQQVAVPQELEDARHKADYWKRMHDEVRAELIILQAAAPQPVAYVPLSDDCKCRRHSMTTFRNVSDRERQLAAEREEYKAHAQQLMTTLLERTAERDALKADALRYRWLRDNKATHNGYCWIFQTGPILRHSESLYAAIDAAMKEGAQ